jgi:hypothetical protein
VDAVDEGVEPGLGVGTQAYVLNPVDPAPAPASDLTAVSVSAAAPSSRFASISPRSRSADGEEHRAERIPPSTTSPPSTPSESGDDVSVRNGDAGGGEVELGSRAEDDSAVEAAGGKVGSRSRSASVGSNDGNGESKRASGSVDELYQDSGLADVQIDHPPAPPHESRNANTMDIVIRPSTPNQRPLLVIQNVDTDASADAHSPEREPDTDTPSSSESPMAASDSSL